MMIKQIKYIAMATIIAASPMLLGANDSPPISKQVSRDFTSVAKTAIPAVVSIKIKAPEREALRKQPMETPFQGFYDDFFEQFFGRGFNRHQPREQENTWIGQASGFIVSSDGYILTNNHVVKNAGQIKVLLNDGQEFDAEVIGQDPNTDIAVIKVDGNKLPYLALANSNDLEVGQWVVAIGNPLGLQASLTVGVVSAKGRNNLDLAHIEDFIQTDAAINRGNSGGPLLDLDGNVVGMNTAIASNMGGYMGIGFAIPSTMTGHVMDQIIHDGSVSRGYLGVTLQSVDQDLAQAFGVEKARGALVSEVRPNSPARKAGIKQGDIIIKLNQSTVQNIATLRNGVAMMKPGTKAELTLMRDGKLVVLPVEVGNFPTSMVNSGVTENKLGFDVEALTPEIAQNLGLLNERGVVVNKVKPGSPAAWTGMKKGALVLEVNQKKVKDSDEFNQILSNTPEGKPILLLIKQDGQVRFISLKVG